MDLSQAIAFALAQAKWLGPALLATGIAVRLVGRAIARALLAAGILAAAGLAYQEWQALHNPLVSGGILLLGVVVFGLLAWTARGLSFLFAFALIAAAFYLLVYGWVGPSFAESTLGALTWAGAAIGTVAVTGIGGWLHRVPGTPLGAGPVP